MKPYFELRRVYTTGPADASVVGVLEHAGPGGVVALCGKDLTTVAAEYFGIVQMRDRCPICGGKVIVRVTDANRPPLGNLYEFTADELEREQAQLDRPRLVVGLKSDDPGGEPGP